MSKRKTIEDFINTANEIHNNKYSNYSLIYKNERTYLGMYCPNHGYFEQISYNHIGNKQGCFICKIENQILTNEEFILNAKKYKMWSVLKKISREIKTNKSSSEIYILTARSSIVKSHIFEFLKKNGIDVEIDNIITMGDNIGEINISEEKRKELKKLAKEYVEVLFFDDDPHNIEIGNSIKGVKTRLVENKII